MAVIINTNVDSIKIQNNLTKATEGMSKIMQRMSSGLKVNSAKDDAAGCVIAAKMDVQLDGNQIAQNNVQNANSLLSTAEGNLDVVEDNLVRIRDLALQAKNGTYSKEEIKAMQDEVVERIAEIDRISTSSMFSSLQLFGAGTSDNPEGLAKDGATFQVGANAEQNNTITADKKLFQSVKFKDLINTGIKDAADNTSVTDLESNEAFDLTKMSGSYGTNGEIAGAASSSFACAVEALDLAINNITERKSLIGSAGNRLDSALSTLTTQYENLSSAKSVITDADVAAEASNYTQQSILQQVSTSLLSQANQAPAIALSLV